MRTVYSANPEYNKNPNLKRDRAKLIEKLFAADTSDPKIVKGIFDMARNGNDVPTGRRVRDLAAYRARPEPKQGQGISRKGT